MNPFTEKYDSDINDNELIEMILTGDRHSLEELILRHQAWIYNIALRMTIDPVEAEDVTQEILIKIMTKLSLYDQSKSSFRTWLYRIVANHVLNLQKSQRVKTVTEIVRDGGYHDLLNEIKDTGFLASPERYVMYNEAKSYCLSGMLICLDPKQRLVFILGAILNVTDVIGSEILSMSRDNFRKILSRSRDKLYNFFSQNCSLMDESNPCKCSLHEEHLKKLGLLHDNETGREEPTYRSIGEHIESRLNDMEDYYSDFLKLYREQPLVDPPDVTAWLKNLLNTERFRDVFHLH